MNSDAALLMAKITRLLEAEKEQLKEAKVVNPAPKVLVVGDTSLGSEVIQMVIEAAKKDGMEVVIASRDEIAKMEADSLRKAFIDPIEVVDLRRHMKPPKSSQPDRKTFFKQRREDVRRQARRFK